VDVGSVDEALVAELARLAVGRARLRAAIGHSDRVAVRVVVAALVLVLRSG
jgi:hypothetical protein